MCIFAVRPSNSFSWSYQLNKVICSNWIKDSKLKRVLRSIKILFFVKNVTSHLDWWEVKHDDEILRNLLEMTFEIAKIYFWYSDASNCVDLYVVENRNNFVEVLALVQCRMVRLTHNHRIFRNVTFQFQWILSWIATNSWEIFFLFMVFFG